MKVFVTKYACSDGIIELEVDRSSSDPENRVYGPHFQGFELGRDAFLTMEEAVPAAEALRVKKIVSLKKQIAKLEKLTFAAE